MQHLTGFVLPTFEIVDSDYARIWGGASPVMQGTQSKNPFRLEINDDLHDQRR